MGAHPDAAGAAEVPARTRPDPAVLTHLGRPSSAPIETLDLIPWVGGDLTVTLSCTEFTSLCPVTGQPDFADLVIVYRPLHTIAETKSVKLYLWRFRDRGEFNERIVAELADDLFRQIRPRWLRVTGRFALRGGIGVTAEAERGGPADVPG